MNISQHILAGISGKDITKDVRDLILKYKILGFILYERNIDSADALHALTKEFHSLGKQAGYDLILAVDQEGGRVARLPEPYTQLSPMRSVNEAEEAFKLGKLLASEVKAAGFNLNFAPIVDVDINPNNPIIGDRSFSSNPQTVSILAGEVIHGHLDEGVAPCLKHFPGHGATDKDSHLELPVDDRELSELQKIDLIPFENLISNKLAPSIMTAHVMYPKIDPDYPATLSSTIINDVLRKDLGYQGLVFSDDFLMKAIRDNYDLAEAAKLFFQASGDVVLICDEPKVTIDVIQKLETEAIDLSEQARRLSVFRKNYLASRV